MGRPPHYNWNLYGYTTADWNHPTMLSRVVGDQIHVEYTDLLPWMDMYGRISGGGLQQQDLCGHSTTVIICSPTGGQVNVAPSCMPEITGDGGCWQVYDYGWMAHSSGYRPHYTPIGIFRLSRIKGGAIFHWYVHNDRNVWPGYPNVVESMPGYDAVGVFKPTNSFPKRLSCGALAYLPSGVRHSQRQYAIGSLHAHKSDGTLYWNENENLDYLTRTYEMLSLGGLGGNIGGMQCINLDNRLGAKVGGLLPTDVRWSPNIIESLLSTG